MKISFRWASLLLVCLITGLLFAACSTVNPGKTSTNEAPEPSSTPSPTTVPTATKNPPTSTPTNIPPTETPTSTPTETPTNTPTITPTETVTPTVTSAPVVQSNSESVNPDKLIRIYFILQGTGGPVCGTDSVFPVITDIKRSPDVEQNIKNALNRLFSYRSEWNGSFYNPLFRSRMKAKKVEFTPASGLVVVTLSGSYTPSGDDCDNTRVRGQVWTTIRQFNGVKGVQVNFENGIKLGDRVSNDK